MVNEIKLRQPFGAGSLTIDGTPVRLTTSLRWRNHSPTGFSWGYGGSGPAQTAFAILLHVVDRPTAERHYMAFKDQHVASWDQNQDHDIQMDVAAWCAEQERAS